MKNLTTQRTQEGTILANQTKAKIMFTPETRTVALRYYVADYPLDESALPVAPQPGDRYFIIYDPESEDTQEIREVILGRKQR